MKIINTLQMNTKNGGRGERGKEDLEKKRRNTIAHIGLMSPVPTLIKEQVAGVRTGMKRESERVRE